MATRGQERARSDAEVSRTISNLTEGYTQKELSEVLGLHPSAVSRALAGKRAFNLREVALLADWLGIDADDIIFARESALAWRCDSGQSGEDAACLCREVVKDFLAFRAVGS